MSLAFERLARWLVVAAVVVALVGCGGAKQQVEYHCPMHPEVVASRPGDCPICGMKLVATSAVRPAAAAESASQALYVCPMHPEVTSPSPGKCPICGMNLVPSEKPASGGSGAASPAGLTTVTVPEAKRALLGMTTGEAATRRFTRHVRAAARIVADETRLFRVTAPAEGWVDKLFVEGVGDVVHKGAPLLELFNIEALNALRRDLYTLGNVTDPTAGVDTRPQERQRSDPFWQPTEFLLARVRRWGFSDEQIKANCKAPADLKNLILYSTANGEVAEKSVIPGQRLQAGDQLFVLADLSHVWAEADLLASDGALVRAGENVEIQAPALPGRTFSGRLMAAAPFLDAQTRTQRVRIELPNPDAVLHPGLPALATMTLDLGDRLAVPASAVLHTGERAYAFRIADADRLVPVAVRTGITDGDFVEVLDGLAAGDRVVTSATFLIDSESAMAAALKAVSGH